MKALSLYFYFKVIVQVVLIAFCSTGFLGALDETRVANTPVRLVNWGTLAERANQLEGTKVMLGGWARVEGERRAEILFLYQDREMEKLGHPEVAIVIEGFGVFCERIGLPPAFRGLLTSHFIQVIGTFTATEFSESLVLGGILDLQEISVLSSNKTLNFSATAIKGDPFGATSR